MAVSDQSFGELLGQFQALKEDVAELKANTKESFTEIKGENRAILKVLGEFKTNFDRMDGGWKMLMTIGGIAGAVGAGLTALAIKIWPFLLGTLPKV